MTTPQAFAMASPPDLQTGFGVGHLISRGPRAASRPVSIRFEPSATLRGVRQRFLAYTFSSLLAGPRPSDDADPSRRCQGRFRRPARSRVQAALSFTGQLRLTGGGVLSPPLDRVAPRGALEEIASQQAIGLSTQEHPPRGVHGTRRGPGPSPAQDPLHCRGADPVPQPRQLALYPPV